MISFRSDPRVRQLAHRSFSALTATASLGATLVLAACGDTIHEHYYLEEPPPGTGGSAPSGGGAGSPGEGGNGGAGTPYPGAPETDTPAAEHELDLFSAPGARFWLAVSDEQLAFMNETTSGGVILDAPLDVDLYSPGGSNATFVDHLFITTAGENGSTADYGKVQLKLVGQSSRRPWNRRSIPNFNLDADHFVEGQRVGGFEHLRLNNAQVGSIFREHLTLELFRGLGYAAPLSTYVWASSNVWGNDVAVPMVLVERYKRSFCEREQDWFPGGCLNMWELAGDFDQGDGGAPIPIDLQARLPAPSVFDDPANCQIEACDNARVKELEALLRATPAADGFKVATEDFIDWNEFHRFQCLSWMLGTGDDAIHNSNNVVLVERADGKFQYLPYSVDLSLGQDWLLNVPLAGQSVLARGCQADTACWADTISTCERLIDALSELEPVKMLDDIHSALESRGMLRPGDEQRYEFLRSWLDARLLSLPEELEENRENPGACGDGLVDCGGYCDLPRIARAGSRAPSPSSSRSSKNAQRAGPPAKSPRNPRLEPGTSQLRVNARSCQSTRREGSWLRLPGRLVSHERRSGRSRSDRAPRRDQNCEKNFHASPCTQVLFPPGAGV